MGVFDRLLWFSARLGFCGAAVYGSARTGVWSSDPEQSARILSTLEQVLQVKLRVSSYSAFLAIIVLGRQSYPKVLKTTSRHI